MSGLHVHDVSDITTRGSGRVAESKKAKSSSSPPVALSEIALVCWTESVSNTRFVAGIATFECANINNGRKDDTYGTQNRRNNERLAWIEEKEFNGRLAWCATVCNGERRNRHLSWNAKKKIQWKSSLECDNATDRGTSFAL